VKGTGLGVCALRVTGASVIPESQLVEAAAELTRRDYSRLYLTEFANGTLLTMYRQRGYWRAEFRDPVATLGTAPDACAGVSVTLCVDEGDDSYIQQFRRENGTPTRRLTLEPAIDAARKVIDLKILAAARQ
jgi:hypothetical protein